jgi:hypothetical protein
MVVDSQVATLRGVIFLFVVTPRGKYMSVETILQEIEREIANLTRARNALLGLNGSSSATTTPTNGTNKRGFTSGARARMAAAQKARWEKYRASKGQTAGKSQPAAAAPTRVISASARKRMAAAQKARWAKVRAAKKAA